MPKQISNYDELEEALKNNTHIRMEIFYDPDNENLSHDHIYIGAEEIYSNTDPDLYSLLFFADFLDDLGRFEWFGSIKDNVGRWTLVIF